MRLFLDSNVLTLFIVGRSDTGLIQRHRALDHYSMDDFTRLVSVMDKARGFATSAFVLAETSNLTRQIKGAERPRLMQSLKAFIEVADEIAMESKQIAQSPAFLKLGLTDAAIGALAKDEMLCLIG